MSGRRNGVPDLIPRTATRTTATLIIRPGRSRRRSTGKMIRPPEGHNIPRRREPCPTQTTRSAAVLTLASTRHLRASRRKAPNKDSANKTSRPGRSPLRGLDLPARGGSCEAAGVVPLHAQAAGMAVPECSRRCTSRPFWKEAFIRPRSCWSSQEMLSSAGIIDPGTGK